MSIAALLRWGRVDSVWADYTGARRGVQPDRLDHRQKAFLALEAARESLHGEHALTVEAGEVRLPMSVSAGLASYSEDGERSQELVRRAGDAMYRAREAGANKVCLAREERMVTKTSHYTWGQLDRLARLAEQEGVGEAVLLREALDDLLRKHTL